MTTTLGFPRALHILHSQFKNYSGQLVDFWREDNAVRRNTYLEDRYGRTYRFQDNWTQDFNAACTDLRYPQDSDTHRIALAFAQAVRNENPQILPVNERSQNYAWKPDSGFSEITFIHPGPNGPSQPQWETLSAFVQLEAEIIALQRGSEVRNDLTITVQGLNGKNVYQISVSVDLEGAPHKHFEEKQLTREGGDLQNLIGRIAHHFEP